MMRVESWFDRYKIPEKNLQAVEKKNGNVLKVLFIVALVFGIVMLLFLTGFTIAVRKQSFFIFLYYAFYVVVGSLGLISIHFKLPSKVLSFYAFICLEVILFSLLLATSMINSLIAFIGICFAFIMFLEINPFFFSGFFIQAFCIFLFSQKIELIARNNTQSSILMVNMGLLFGTLIYLVFWKRRHVVEDMKRNDILSTQQEKTDGLLRNILPENVIKQIRETGRSCAEEYSDVSVLHTDIVNFTKTTSDMDPEVVINELNEIFTAFDYITGRYGCMRIKTIGDAYVAVCGLPEPSDNHAEKMISCAQDFISYLNARNQTSKIKWAIRIGISSGKVIAGVIGIRKYVYDILGDTVDGAVKTEEKGESMSIAISEETYNLVKDKVKISNKDGSYFVAEERKVSVPAIKESELKKGDMLLYSFINLPEFIKLDESKGIKDFVVKNFMTLIDRLIIWAEQSNTTHAALVYDFTKDKNTGKEVAIVAEATLPNCRTRNGAYADGMKVIVHRLPDGIDGEPVLEFLPPLGDGETGYAMTKAVMAGLICLFRTRVAKDDPKLLKIMALLKLISYPISNYIEKLLQSKSKKTSEPFFCSQLATYCYNMAAYKTSNPAYKIETPADNALGNSILDFLIENKLFDLEEAPLPKNDLLTALPSMELANPHIAFAIADIIGEEELKNTLLASNDNNLYLQCLNLADDYSKIVPSIKRMLKNLLLLCGESLEELEDNFAEKLIKFKASFVMPSDLENVLETIGEVTDA